MKPEINKIDISSEKNIRKHYRPWTVSVSLRIAHTPQDHQNACGGIRVLGGENWDQKYTQIITT